MDIFNSRLLIKYFPTLESRLIITSRATTLYNCTAFANDDCEANWAHNKIGVKGYYWPQDMPTDGSLHSYLFMYTEYLNYEKCIDEAFEDGYDKIAVFAINGDYTHTARQVNSILWKSKIGSLEDIHHRLRWLEGDAYGYVEAFMKRRK